MSETLLLYCYLIPSVLIAGISKGGFGGGAAFVSTLIVASIMEPTRAVALMLLVFVFMDQINVVFYWRTWRFSILGPLLLWSAVGLFFGFIVFDFLDAAIIKLLMVGIVIAFWLLPLLPLRGLLPASSVVWKFAVIVAGGSAGFSSFVANAGGPPIVAYLVKVSPTKTIFQGCTAFFFWWINLAKLPLFVSLDLYSRDTLFLAAVMIPVAIVGIAIGMFAHSHVSEKAFRRIVQVLLFFAVLQLLYASLAELLFAHY